MAVEIKDGKKILVTPVSAEDLKDIQRAIAYNIINMSIYIHLRKCMQIFENGFKIFLVNIIVQNN